MILTTNRVSILDPAFESRIHIIIKYPALNYESRLRIWQTFLSLRDAQRLDLSEREIKRLAKKKLNGRQIKNVAKAATLLARSYDEPLSISHIEMVMRVNKGPPNWVSGLATQLWERLFSLNRASGFDVVESSHTPTYSPPRTPRRSPLVDQQST